MRVITFSRTYPSYHSKAGEPTWFVEKLLKSLNSEEAYRKIFDYGTKIHGVSHTVHVDCIPKHHTVRIGNRWKAGDWFSPRVWGTNINPKSGRSGPYHSEQIEIAPPVQITHTYDLQIYKTAQKIDEISQAGESFVYYLKQAQWLYNDHLSLIAANDGLNLEDFKEWIFTPIRKGKDTVKPAQIICWNKEVDYDDNPDWLPF